MNKIEARAHVEDGWWVIEVDGYGATQTQKYDQVEHMARALVADVDDVPIEDVTVVVDVQIPEIAAARRKATEAQRLAAEAAEAQRVAVLSLLRTHKLSGRQVARIMKVTPGRVSQIAARAQRAK